MKKLIALLLAAAALALCGCVPGRPEPEPSAAATAAPTESAAPSYSPAPLDGPTGYAAVRIDHARELMDLIIPFIQAHPIPVYSADHGYVFPDKRSGLTPAEAELYDTMKKSAESFEAAVFEGGEQETQNALAALFVDEPVTETYFTVRRDGSRWRSVFFDPEVYPFAPAEDIGLVREKAAAFTAVGEYVASRIPDDFSALDKYRALAYYIILNTEYLHTHGTTPNYVTCAYGAVVNGYSICQGYALGFEYLCRVANLDCRRVRNPFNDDNMHFWDIVTLDQGTYYVDVTWSDSAIALHQQSWTIDDYADERFFRWFVFPADDHHPSDDGTTTNGRAFDKKSWYIF
ncbi:MAG: hypothetical protein IKS43_03810 [Clostridia bacterium]|nr:hypothetical protein [Clostridia bacterium]